MSGNMDPVYKTPDNAVVRIETSLDKVDLLSLNEMP